MTFAGALRTYLLSDTAIAGAVGGERIYTGSAPQGVTNPYAVLQMVSENVRGDGVDELDGQQEDEWQIDVWASSYALSESLSNAIRDRINGLKKTMMSNFMVYSVTQESRQHTTESEGAGSDIMWTRFYANYTIVRDTEQTT